ncbi:MAG: helix-turn-helix domain-containing protein [Spirochaetota bacterium]|nr:helix-turn-helix domain-containing protein [Spirochaetota bacterium]
MKFHRTIGKPFMQHKGMKMSEYINSLHIKKAKELLIGSDQDVTQIASMIGFNSLSTFYHTLQKMI